MDIDDFGKMLFGNLVGYRKGYSRSSAIAEKASSKAKELIYQLIDLNETEGWGYQLQSYYTRDGKIVKPTWERIEEAQQKLWRVKISDLKIGDRIFFSGGDIDYGYGNYDTPIEVKVVSDAGVYVEHPFDRYGLLDLGCASNILRVPEDFDEYHNKYWSEEYWLEQANKLGI